MNIGHILSDIIGVLCIFFSLWVGLVLVAGGVA